MLDPETVGSEPPRVVNDLPDGGPRLAQGATGIHAVIVNGTLTLEGGRASGDTSGRLLR